MACMCLAGSFDLWVHRKQRAKTQPWCASQELETRGSEKTQGADSPLLYVMAVTRKQGKLPWDQSYGRSQSYLLKRLLSKRTARYT